MMKLNEDGSLNAQIGGYIILCQRQNFGRNSTVPLEGINTVVVKSPSKDFVVQINKRPNQNCGGIPKKYLKDEYQLLFEFFNKELLPGSEKRTFDSAA